MKTNSTNFCIIFFHYIHDGFLFSYVILKYKHKPMPPYGSVNITVPTLSLALFGQWDLAFKEFTV